MNIPEAEKLARSLMDEHELTDWTFEFDNAKKRFGLCDHNKKKISISFYLTAMNDKESVTDVILHEIAHALAGFEAGHDYGWKRTALSIGANPNRTYDSNTVVAPQGRWIAYCPVHGAVTEPRHRRTKNRVCRRCKENGVNSPIEWRER